MKLEKAICVALRLGQTDEQAEASLEELRSLTESAGAAVLATVLQQRDTADPATFIGKGKTDDIRQLVERLGADTVVVDSELGPTQLRNLEDTFKCKVIDRTALIIDIFAQRAHSSEAKLQVELAQMAYFLPRLRGWGESMSRQGATGSGGIATRGPGETKIEIDRRKINRRMAKLRRDLETVDRVRATKRAQRERKGVPAIALVGYTNAGKSTLLNQLTSAGVLVEDKLFATLDPTTRRLDLPEGRQVTLTDTVGFVRKLPHPLVEAFASTLEESIHADLLLHVVDASGIDPEAQYASVREVLEEIGASQLSELVVLNKADQLDASRLISLQGEFPEALAISALTGQGVETLLGEIERRVSAGEIEVDLEIPYARGDLAQLVEREGANIARDYGPEGVRLHARLRPELLARVREFRV
ncbi:MAG: GTPase HflX [Actinomycetota bacterium]